MSDTFDWAGLAKEVSDVRYFQGKEPANDLLRTRIEAAFVPVELYEDRHAQLMHMRRMYDEATARAEAAEARNKVLRKGLVGIQNAAALVVENDKPDRVKWDGEWHEGPLATAYIRTLQAIGQLAHSALGGEHER